MKKNNKGFSLVELIVVVLIMGIIAVALAPQVMKWVGTARTNSDSNSAKDIKSAIQIAVADAQNQGVAVPVTSTAVPYTASGIASLGSAFAGIVEGVTGADYTVKPNSSAHYLIEINANGVVTVTY